MKTREIVAVTVALLAFAMTSGAAPGNVERGNAEKAGRRGQGESISDQDAAFMQMMRRYGEAYKRGDREAADKIARGMRRRIAANAKPQMERPERRPAKAEASKAERGGQRTQGLERGRPERPQRGEGADEREARMQRRSEQGRANAPAARRPEMGPPPQWQERGGDARERFEERREMMRENWERRREELQERRKSMDEQRRPGRSGDADWAEKRSAARERFEDRREMMREMREKRRDEFQERREAMRGRAGECPFGNEPRLRGGAARYDQRRRSGPRAGFEGMDRGAQPRFGDRPGGRRPEMGPRGDRRQSRRPKPFQPRRHPPNERPRRLMAY